MPFIDHSGILDREALDDVPIASIIEKLGGAVGMAQFNLDKLSVEMAALLQAATVDVPSGSGGTQTKSLLELGFAPVFYTVEETSMEATLTLALRVVDVLDNAGAATGERDTELVGTLVTHESRKFGFDVAAASRLTAKIKAQSAPQALLDQIGAGA